MQAVIKKLFLSLDLGKAVSSPRVHHQLLPDTVYTLKDRQVPFPVMNGLKKIGHNIANTTGFSVVQAIYRENSDTVYAISDPRKKGTPAGY